MSSIFSIGENFIPMYGMIGSLAGQVGNLDVLNTLDSLSNANTEEPQEETSTDDMRWGLTADLTVSQIIFSGAYLVGLQTSKTYKSLSEISVEKSEEDIIESVTNAYYLVLISAENKSLLEETLKNTEELLKQMQEMNKQGFIEDTDVDQLKLTLSNLKNASETLKRQNEVAKLMLKFQMGFDMNSEIELTDNLDPLLLSSDIMALITNDYKVENSTDYKLFESQERLAEMNLKLQKSTFLPEIVAFYSHQENFNDKAFSFTPPDIVGVNINIPIFGSGMKLAKTKQAKLEVEKMKNSKDQLASGLKTSFYESKYSLQSAYSKYLTNKENVELSKRIYDKTLIKYKEGVSSSLDLTQIQNQYIQSQTNYFTAVFELLNAKNKLDKALNNY